MGTAVYKVPIVYGELISCFLIYLISSHTFFRFIHPGYIQIMVSLKIKNLEVNVRFYASNTHAFIIISSQ